MSKADKHMDSTEDSAQQKNDPENQEQSKAEKAPTIMIVAGENSGDILGAGLVSEIQKLYPKAKFVGVTGEKLKASGVETIFPIDDLNVMGLIEVIPHLKRLFARRDTLVEYVQNNKVDLLLTIDFQEFNASLAKKVKNITNIPCVHYVSPTIWVWRRGRVKKMARYLDHVLALFPFEPELYYGSGLKCTFVGHPLAQEMRGMSQDNELSASLSLALLPGSRKGLIRKLLPDLLTAVKRLKFQLEQDDSTPAELNVVVPVVADEHKKLIQDLAIENDFDPALISFVKSEDRFEELSKCHAAVAASGTSNLELALLGVPMLIVYRLNQLTYWILRPFIDAPYGSPVNWVAGRKVIPELIQQEFTPLNAYEEIRKLLMDPITRNKQLAELNNVRQALGESQDVSASAIAAEVVSEYL